MTLADYRRRYAQYKTDPDLQAAHAAAPWLVVPDDHEVENNYAEHGRAADNTPALTAAQWTARRTAAYQAYYENMPLRPAQAHSGNSIPLYRRVRWGNLATFHMLDTRQYRNDQACGDGWKVCSDADLASRSLPGNAQEAWLLDGLGQHSAPGTSSASRSSSPGGSTRPARQHGRVGRLPRLPSPHPAGLGRPRRAQPGRAHRRRAPRRGPTTSRPTTPTPARPPSAPSWSPPRSPPAATATAPPRSPTSATNPHLKFYSDRRGYVRTTISPTPDPGRLPRGGQR